MTRRFGVLAAATAVAVVLLWLVPPLGLIAGAVIFGGGALAAFVAMLWPHDAVQVQAYWNAGGMSHAFWYATAAALGCVGYGSVFLAVRHQKDLGIRRQEPSGEG